MEATKVRTHIGNDGILKLELPTSMANLDLEVLIVMQPLEAEAVDEMGYPIGYFNETYGSLAEDLIERGDEPPLDVREPLE
jgi:hypothetical protein